MKVEKLKKEQAISKILSYPTGFQYILKNFEPITAESREDIMDIVDLIEKDEWVRLILKPVKDDPSPPLDLTFKNWASMYERFHSGLQLRHDLFGLIEGGYAIPFIETNEGSDYFNAEIERTSAFNKYRYAVGTKVKVWSELGVNETHDWDDNLDPTFTIDSDMAADSFVVFSHLDLFMDINGNFVRERDRMGALKSSSRAAYRLKSLSNSSFYELPEWAIRRITS